MKIKNLALILALLLALVSLFSACTGETEDTAVVYYTVTFDSSGGTAIDPKQIKSGSSFIEPDAPEKEGYIFDGWYCDGKEWDFDFNTVTKDIILKAMWLSPSAVFTHQPIGDGTTVITGLKKVVNNIVLPKAIDGYDVVAIGDNAFDSMTSEEKMVITVPECITSIGNEAFYKSTDIEIIIKGELLSVGERAFMDCTGLKNIRFAEGIERISTEAFLGCTSLTSIRLPKSVKVVEENAFDDCSSLETLLIYTDIEEIEDQAFYDTAIELLYIHGTELEADDLLDPESDVIQGQNPKLFEASVLIYSEEEPADKTNSYDGYWYMDENGQTRKWN